MFCSAYAQPEAQCTVASSQDSNASLAVNHWINTFFFFFSQERAFLRWCLIHQSEQMGETVAIKEKQLWGEILSLHNLPFGQSLNLSLPQVFISAVQCLTSPGLFEVVNGLHLQRAPSIIADKCFTILSLIRPLTVTFTHWWRLTADSSSWFSVLLFRGAPHAEHGPPIHTVCTFKCDKQILEHPESCVFVWVTPRIGPLSSIFTSNRSHSRIYHSISRLLHLTVSRY